MNLNTIHLTVSLLALSVVLLILLLVGGAIENRDFSAINPVILIGFNAYLISLMISSLLLLPFIYIKNRFAIKATILISLSYIVVYMLDLSHLFPQPPSPMSTSLFWTEIIGLFLAVPLLMLTIDLVKTNDEQRPKTIQPAIPIWQIVILILISILIISFASLAAIT
jgi:hypothetical protein